MRAGLNWAAAVWAALFAGMLAVSAAGAQQTPDPAALFGARESVEQIDLSPDGRRIVYLTPGPGASTAVVVQDLAGGAAPRIPLRSDGDPERVRWCRFAGNERLVCRIAALIRTGTTFVGFERLVSFDLDGNDPQLLGRHTFGQFDGSIIDWLPDQSGVVLMARAGGVSRLDVRTLRSVAVEPANSHASAFMTDGRGRVRMMETAPVRGSTGMDGRRIAYFYRTPDGGRWRPLGDYDALTGGGQLPLAVDPTLNAAYVLRKLDGRRALYRVSLDGSETAELVHSNPDVDIDGVVRVGRGTRVIGVTFADAARRKIYFDADFAQLARTLGRALPNLPLIDFVETSLDGGRILVHASSDSDSGRYFLYERATRNLNEIMLDRPQLETVRLAAVRPMTYPAADGVLIPAYLTLPPGSEGRNLPAVLLPHGGPGARDEWGFDWLAQYLAHQGYAVLQPNYRGSTGYGDQWLRSNGFRSWRTSIGDIAAGARWLATQGIADPRRTAILGWSYGGYAALQAGVVEPGLFRAIVAIAPVTDLQQVKDDVRMFTSRRNVAEYIGSGPHVAEGSPLRHAERIAAPVLLFHGDRDVNVPVTHSRRMDEALREAGKRSELVRFPGLEHDLADGDARTRMLRRIGEFLGAELAAR
jgi:dipeptidyl aminopeptidase/acylaminoacyl peptidase